MKLIPLALALITLAAPSFSQDEASGVRPVKLTVASLQTHKLTRHFYGQVVAKQSVDLAFQIGGQIVEFPVVEGSEVPKDGLIAKLDTEPFELEYDQAVLQKEQADRNLARLSALRGNTVSQVAVDDAETQARLSLIAVRNAEYALEHATLSAPFDALIATRNMANFTTISAGTPVVRLHDMSELRIDIDVPELLFQRASENTDVEFVAIFPASDKEYPLMLREYNAEASNIGQTFRITLGMALPDGLQVLPGSSVTVRARANSVGTIGMPVPTTALVTRPDNSVAVMVFTPAGAQTGVVTLTPVTVKPTDDGKFIVTSGLEDQSEIVATGVHKLADGQSVRRFSGFAN